MIMHRASSEPSNHPYLPRPFGEIVLFLMVLLTAAPAWAIGASPGNPIPFDAATGAIQLTSTGDDLWVNVRFEPASTITHLRLETEGGLDTRMAVFNNRSEALDDQPFAEDDNSGSGRNAAIAVPLGFGSPYLVRIGTSRAGATALGAELMHVATERCDWPSSCTLETVARQQPTALETLRTLRSVRSEILAQTEQGRDLVNLYWKLGRDLVPDLLVDHPLRRRVYQEVTALLPLAQDALAVATRTGGGGALSRSDYRRLEGLLALTMTRLSPDLADQLQERWEMYDLGRLVGMPLAAALEETGLLPAAGTPNTIIVKLRDEPSTERSGGRLRLRIGRASLDARLAAAGAADVRRVHGVTPARRAAGLTRTIAFEVEGPTAARDLVAELATDPGVEWAEIAATLRPLAGPRTDPYRGDLWGLDAVRAPVAWSRTRGRCDVPVAIVDTGLRPGLVDLEGNTLHRLGYDFIDDDPDPQDGFGHGTHVAGTVASAVDNAVSIGGVAPEACVFAVKVLSDEGDGSAEGVAEGIVHAVDAGARVINLSLGCDCGVQNVIEDALRYAARNDVVVIAAAGNDGVEGLYYPASSPRTVSVAALEPDESLAGFSNYGEGLDLSAPGVDVVSLFKDGESCIGQGTSMAAPHVSGVAALVRAANPGLGREAIRDVLRSSAADLGAPGYDTKFGAGIVDAIGALGAADGAGEFFTSAAFPGYRFRIRITAGDQVIAGRDEVDCIGETLCVSGALPGRSELFLRIIGPRPNGFFWVNLVRFTTSRVEMWVERIASGKVKYYDLPALPPGSTKLTGLVDKQAFPSSGSAGAVIPSETVRPASAVVPRPSPATFTADAFPGYRFKVRIFSGGTERPARLEGDCLSETVCVSGALPGRSELFLRIIGPRPNGFLWVNLVRFTTSRVEVEVEKLRSGVTRRYVLPAVPRGSDALDGLVDKEAFSP